MNVYEVGLDVRLKEYGEKRPVIKDRNGSTVIV